jgi:hypothetical protein
VFAEERRVVHLYWHGSQWVLHLDLDPALNYDNYLGYCKVRVRGGGGGGGGAATGNS